MVSAFYILRPVVNKVHIGSWLFFAYSESKLTCHFVLVLLVVVVLLVLGGKRSKKVGKRSKKVTFS